MCTTIHIQRTTKSCDEGPLVLSVEMFHRGASQIDHEKGCVDLSESGIMRIM